MITDPIYQRLLEVSWRRQLTPAEEAELQAWLAAHPEAQAEWEAEAGLNQALNQLPPVPVASNFTARVLQAVERETAAESPAPGLRWRSWRWQLRWLPRAAFAGLVLWLGLFSYHQVQAARRTDMMRSVAAVAGVSSLPEPEILKDFEAIRVLQPTPPADLQLLMLME